MFDRMNRGIAGIAVFAIVMLPVAAQAGALGTIVPSYFYPGTGGPGGSGDGWAAMTTAASQIPLTAILNPNSGPGSSVDSNYVNALTNLEVAGGTAIAYIYTGYGSVPLATVESQVDTYISQYGPLINGFFVDTMSNLPAELSYYESLYAYIKGLNSTYEVVGNAGTATLESYVTSHTADVFVTYENDDLAHPYASSPPPSWVYGYPAGDFASVIYDQPSVAGMQADVNTALTYNVGHVYVTDESLNPPTGYLYDRLPSYWDQEVAAIKAADAGVPEPAMLAMWAMAGLVACCLRSRASGSRHARSS
jgi:hypothetical protein